MNKVGIIGAGLIGRAWAIVFARSGWDVTLYDSVAEVRGRVKADILASLKELTPYGLGADAAAVEPRIHVTDTIAKTVEGVSFVQENGPETIEAKLAIFGELDRVAPADAILASSSSAIVASRFTEKLKTRARCLVAHPVNPPHIVPIVELAPAPWTSLETVSRAKGNLRKRRAGADPREKRGRGLHPQPSARRATGGGVPAGRRGLRVAARPRQDYQGRPRPALVVPRPVRHHRAQCAWRRRRLLRPLSRLLPAAARRSAELGLHARKTSRG